MATVGIMSKTFWILTTLVCAGEVVVLTAYVTRAVVEEVARVDAVLSDLVCFFDRYEVTVS